jgi:hypothetical protein
MRNLSFKQFCDKVKGHKFYNKQGSEIYKYELYYLGINPHLLMINETKYIKMKRK